MSLLGGYRVLDLTDERGLIAGRIFADLGADVVQVEPFGGSTARRTPPIARTKDSEQSMYWAAFAANKRSIECDIEDDADRESLLALVAVSHFFVTSLDPQLLRVRNLDWSALSKVNPGLVYVQITPFGLTGPKAEYAASDLIVWASSGALHPNRDDVLPPVRLSSQQSFLHAGADAVVGALIAHRHRQRTGEGQLVDISAQISSAQATISRVLADAVDDNEPGWNFDKGPIDQSGSGSATPSSEKKWQCKDGLIEMPLNVGQASGRFTNQLCAWMRSEGELPAEFESIDWRLVPDLIEQGSMDAEILTRFRTAVAGFFATRTKEDANDAAVTYKLNCSGIRDASDVATAAQFAARGLWVDLESGDTTQRLPGPFVKTTPGALTFRRGAPRVGEHTKEVLSEWLSSDSAFWETSKADGNGGAMPLAGLKVLDFSWVVAGPMVGRTFADFGATVVRAESQAHLDTARRMKPYKNGEPGVERSSVYANCNAGKLGITLDLEQERARAIAHDLANWADVIVESYSPGVVARWGLDYESLSSHRRDLIMISSALNGQTGPMASLAGYGGTGASLSGYQGLAGWPDRLPIGPFGPYTDYLAPRFSLATLLAALDYRDRTGEGCYIDVSQIECGVFFLSPEMADYFTTGSVARPFGNNDPRYAPHGVYRTSSDDGTDHFVAVAVTTDEQWEALANLLAGPELAGDRRFRTGSARLEYREELDDLVGAWCATRDAASAEKLLQANGVPAHRSSSSYDFCEDEQLAHRHHLVRLPHPIFGETVVEGPRYQLNLTPGVVRRAAPTFGQDSEYVLTELLGYSESVAAELLSSGVLT